MLFGQGGHDGGKEGAKKKGKGAAGDSAGRAEVSPSLLDSAAEPQNVFTPTVTTNEDLSHSIPNSTRRRTARVPH